MREIWGRLKIGSFKIIYFLENVRKFSVTAIPFAPVYAQSTYDKSGGGTYIH